MKDEVKNSKIVKRDKMAWSSPETIVQQFSSSSYVASCALSERYWIGKCEHSGYTLPERGGNTSYSYNEDGRGVDLNTYLYNRADQTLVKVYTNPANGRLYYIFSSNDTQWYGGNRYLGVKESARPVAAGYWVRGGSGTQHFITFNEIVEKNPS